MSEIHGRLITYCSNIHPAESWAETFAALRAHLPAVKGAVAPDRPFPIGLRLSSRAALEITPEDDLAFRAWLADSGCFVPTINGFPFGSFHSERIKESVYLPDWRSRERADYTIRLADLLAGWLPLGVQGSISTVPLAFTQSLGRDPYHEIQITRRLEHVLAHLARLDDETGKTILLALEPEPGCLLETTEEVCRFFERSNFHPRLRRHLGICFDCCHQAVQFEDPAESLRLLSEAGVTVAKIQVSSALQAGADHISLLDRFQEPCYLHQVVVRSADRTLSRYLDLPDALAAHPAADGDLWRCHFHVPVFSSGWGELETTQKFLEGLLPLVGAEVLLEVETYTWEALPPELREISLTESIIRELAWLKELVHA